MTKRKAIPISAARVRELLDYDPATGALRWKQSCGAAGRGSSAGGVKHNKHGTYITVKIDRQRYYAHRVIWLWMTGEFPACVIDHKDHCGTNNSWANLRAATFSQNLMNARFGKGKPRGVYFERRRGKFLARVGSKHIGYFSTQAEAVAAQRQAAKEAFGEFFNQ